MAKTVSSNGARYYINPTTGERARGVTSVCSMLPKPWLGAWSAKVVAESAFDEFGALSSFVQSGDRHGAVNWLKRTPYKAKDEGAITGTAIHELTETMDELGGIPKLVSARQHGYARGYLDFLENFEPTYHLSETSVLHTELNYAGTLDRLVEFPETIWGDTEPPGWYQPGARYVLDVKTTRSGVFPETALQLAAYRNATEIIGETENGEPTLTPTGFDDVSPTGLVLWLRPNEWALVPLDAGDAAFGIFQACLSIFDWDKDLSKTVVKSPTVSRAWSEPEIIEFGEILERLS